ncbi:MAG: secondary thiamine-phosphate synthase enzyme YjbQ [Candidatus Paceibacterota bacterium]
MKIFNKEIEKFSSKTYDFIDLSEEIIAIAKESQIKNGLINIQSLHTSAAVLCNENEPLLLDDFRRNLEMTAEKAGKYQHDNLAVRTVNICAGECINGHAHCKAIHLPTSITLNLIEGQISFGQWQRIFLLELDQARPRRVQIMIIGE